MLNKFVLVFLLIANSAVACQTTDIQIKSMRVNLVDACKTRSCPAIKGVAVLINHCRTATGAQLQLTAFDKKDAPVATMEFWPASIRNIPPGEYIFNLDGVLRYEREMDSFRLSVVSVRTW